MIRSTVFGISLLALTSASAFAAPKHHEAKARVMAEATPPASDTTAPAGDKTDKADKKAKKASKKEHGKTDAKEIKAPAATVAPASAPASATK